jgi:hypothetical protein
LGDPLSNAADGDEDAQCGAGLGFGHGPNHLRQNGRLASPPRHEPYRRPAEAAMRGHGGFDAGDLARK